MEGVPPSSASTGARLGRAAAALLRPRPAGAARPAVQARAVAEALGRSGRHFGAHAGRAAKRLGLQIAAVLYFMLALTFGSAGVKGWLAYRREPVRLHHVLSLTEAAPWTQVELALALVFLYLAMSSLWRAARHAA